MIIDAMLYFTIGALAGAILGYMVGSDNGFVKGCNWAYHNRDKKLERRF